MSHFFHSWNNPSSLPEEEIKIERTKEIDKKLEVDRAVNNVWWPWKNYDDWLNGRGLKAEPPKKKEKKIRKEKKDKKKNRKNGKKRKKEKTSKKQPKVINGDNVLSPPINSEDNEIIKKGSIPEIQYKASTIDLLLRNSSLIPTLVKYTSRNYTYGAS